MLILRCAFGGMWGTAAACARGRGRGGGWRFSSCRWQQTEREGTRTGSPRPTRGGGDDDDDDERIFGGARAESPRAHHTRTVHSPPQHSRLCDECVVPLPAARHGRGVRLYWVAFVVVEHRLHISALAETLSALSISCPPLFLSFHALISAAIMCSFCHAQVVHHTGNPQTRHRATRKGPRPASSRSPQDLVACEVRRHACRSPLGRRADVAGMPLGRQHDALAQRARMHGWQLLQHPQAQGRLLCLQGRSEEVPIELSVHVRRTHLRRRQ